MTTHKLRQLSSAGDSVVEFNPEVEGEVTEARRWFNGLLANGFTAFRSKPGGTHEQIRLFQKSAEETILVPRIVGG